MLYLLYTILENNSKIADEFFLDKKRQQLFLNLIRFETIIKIDFNDMSTTKSVIHPMKGIVEKLVATPSAIELLIESEIKSLFSFEVNKKNFQKKTRTENKLKGIKN